MRSCSTQLPPASSSSLQRYGGHNPPLVLLNFSLASNFDVPISQDALLNPNRGSLCSLLLLGSQVCYERKYTRSVGIKLFLLNLAVLYPFSFRAWARVLCIIKTSVIKAFPLQCYCICRFLITDNSMYCNRLLKHPCYCTYNFICSLFQSSGLDIFQSLWFTSRNAVTSLYLYSSLSPWYSTLCSLALLALLLYVLMSKAALSVCGTISFHSLLSPSLFPVLFLGFAIFPIFLQSSLTLQIPHNCSIFPWREPNSPGDSCASTTLAWIQLNSELG